MKDKTTVEASVKMSLEYGMENLNVVNRIHSAMIVENYHEDDIADINELRIRLMESVSIASTILARIQPKANAKKSNGIVAKITGMIA